LISFLAAGLMGLVFPLVIGSGHTLIDQLSFGCSLAFLFLIFIAKFFLSMISYVSGVPGGIFFPLLVLGASLGSVFATTAITTLHLPAYLFANFVILAMAGCFTAIVRAPITGIVLLVEMTGSFSHLLPLALISLIAYVVADLLHSKPIYDSLLSNMLQEKTDVPVADADIMFNALVQFGSTAAGQAIRDLPLPKNCLLVNVHRNSQDLIPDGETELQAGDNLTFLTKQANEILAREVISQLISE